MFLATPIAFYPLESISLYKYPVGPIDMSVHLWNISITKLSAVYDLLLNKHCFTEARAAP